MNQIPTRIAYSAGNETLVVSANPIIVHSIMCKNGSIGALGATFRDADNTTLWVMLIPQSLVGRDTSMLWNQPTLFDNGLNIVLDSANMPIVVLFSETG